MISRNSVIAVCTPFTVVFRSSLMSVIITFMFEPAKLQMNWASASGRINLRGDTTGEVAMTASLATRSDARCVSNHIDAFSRQCPRRVPVFWRPISRILRMLRPLRQPTTVGMRTWLRRRIVGRAGGSHVIRRGRSP